MPRISGRVYDVGLGGSKGTMWLTAGFRTGVDGIVAPRRVSYTIVNGELPTNVIVEPGPAHLEIDVGLDARADWPVIIPDHDVTLRELISAAHDWTPVELTAFAELRAAAVAAAGRAESAADRAEREADGARGFRDEAEGFRDTTVAKAGEANGSAAAALEHASEAGLQRWAATDERWATVEVRNETNLIKDDANTARGLAKGYRDEAEGFRSQAGAHAATATEKATEAGGSAALAADFTATSRTLRDQAQAARDIAVANGLTWRGTWAPGTAYAAQDVVTDAGASWRALAASTGVQPAEGGSWSLLAARGAPGTDGATEITWGDVLDKPGTFPPGAHTHGPEDLGTGGLRNGSTFINGLGNWVVPYSVISTDEIETGTSTLARLLSAARLREAIHHRVTGAAGTAVSAIGQALARAATAAEARTAIGAGTSNLALGTTASTAKAGNYVPAWAEVTGKPGLASDTHTHARMDAAPATWLWAGTTLPTAATQVHAQARVGDFIVAPNLTTNPGWHQITGV